LRLAACASILAVCGASAHAALTAPQAPGGRIPEYELDENLLLHEGPFEPVAEGTQRWQYGLPYPYRSLMLGSYARLQRHLKVGAFYRLQYGARDNDDWVRNAQGGWAWNDTNNRAENVMIFDATPRTELKFLPGGSWVGSVKLRFERNTFNTQDVLRVEPELAWFWMNGLTPRATLFLRQETVFALNFGQSTVWQRWYYIGALWHAKPWLSLGPTAALHDERWTTSGSYEAFNVKSQADYNVLFRAWVAGFTVVAHLP
jgi:hypothetical protein